DPLVVRAATRWTHVINDFQRELNERDGNWADTKGSFELSLATDGSKTYILEVVHGQDGEEYPVTVSARLKQDQQVPSRGGHQKALAPLITTASSSTYKTTRRDSDSDLEKPIVSRKRKQEEGGDESDKRQRTDMDDALVTKEDFNELLQIFREDVQHDTAETVNHVQKLLRRFKEEWHVHTDRLAVPAPRGPFRDSVIANGVTPGAAFPSPSVDKDDTNASVTDVICRESKLLSNQIRWVEECRRVATDIHDKREENWRTSAAGFHDRGRVDREAFQNRILQDSTMHGQMLNQILNEVKAIGLYTQSMKWETPEHQTRHQAFPAQSSTPVYQPGPTTPMGRGQGRGTV
ncbi:hypothetical protein P154DRAFT_404468, partial [Amniculicola lignicola CBS 123094]